MTITQNPKVYISDIKEQNLLQEIQTGLEFIQSNEIINKESTIFIKPNLTDAAHKPGITTTPLMIRTVIEAVSPLVKKIYVGESDGGNYSYSADTSLKNHGIFDVAKKFTNVEVVNLSKLPRTRVTERVCGKKVWVDLPDLLLDDIDCLVSVPVLKTHAMTHGTFSIKNLWGCYPDPMRLLYHKNLDYKLALINKLVKNKIQIIDGFWALDGHGPMEGTPVVTNKILISNNPVAADASAAYLMKLDTNKIGHLKVAEQFGLGISDINKIKFNKEISRENLPKFTPYKIKLDYFSVLLFKSEILSKLILASPLTPLIYSVINFLRPKNKRTYWATYNKLKIKNDSKQNGLDQKYKCIVQTRNKNDTDYIIVDPSPDIFRGNFINMNCLPKVSFIIPTFNNEATLDNCLKSLITQEYPDFEIIIIDGYSTDKTVEIAKKYSDKIIFDKGSYGSACQTGIEQSKGEILGLFDSDIIIPHKKWLINAIKFFNYSERVSTVWPDQKAPPNGFYLTKLHFNLYKIIINTRITRKKGLFGGGNSLITRKSINEIGGIDKNIHWGADFDWAQKLKDNHYQVIFIKDFIYHNTMRSAKEFIKKQFVGAKTFTKTGCKLMNLSFSDVLYEHIICTKGMIIGLIKYRDPSWLFYPGFLLVRVIAFMFTYFENIFYSKKRK